MLSAEAGERAGEKGESRILTVLVPSCSQKEQAGEVTIRLLWV